VLASEDGTAMMVASPARSFCTRKTFSRISDSGEYDGGVNAALKCGNETMSATVETSAVEVATEADEEANLLKNLNAESILIRNELPVTMLEPEIMFVDWRYNRRIKHEFSDLINFLSRFCNLFS
jgi:hypothetical protein